MLELLRLSTAISIVMLQQTKATEGHTDHFSSVIISEISIFNLYNFWQQTLHLKDVFLVVQGYC